MSTLTSLARAQAVVRGVAQPIATVRHVHVSNRPLVFIPLGLAGEAHAPLAAMIGTDPRAPRLLVVAQPRDRDQRFGFAAELADEVLPYIESFCAESEDVPVRQGAEPRTRFADAPQVLVPSPAGIGFVRLLGRSTRFRRTDGEFAVPHGVPLLGRWLSYLAERAGHPGSCLLVAATDALSAHWASGQSPFEDLNLAALIGWISPPPGQNGWQAAAAAEDPLRWPPAGPATDPTFDNEVLAPLIAARERAAGGPGENRAQAALAEALAGQLRLTWQLTWRAVDLLRSLPPGEHVSIRWTADRDSFTGYREHLDTGGPPQPRRDSAVAAARRLTWLERAQAVHAVQRAFDDPLVMAEYRLGGEAFAGEVVAAEPDRIDATGSRRKLRPLITIATTDQLLISPGTRMSAPGRPGQSARVVSVISSAYQAGQVVLELSGGMGRSLIAVPGSIPEVGELMCYATLTDSYQPSASFPPAEETPWTHGGPPPPYVPADDNTAAEEASEEWS
ncbi:MAG: hypothetical protein ACRDNZ_19760 [Streptosporangiaceae bacterium]